MDHRVRSSIARYATPLFAIVGFWASVQSFSPPGSAWINLGLCLATIAIVFGAMRLEGRKAHIPDVVELTDPTEERTTIVGAVSQDVLLRVARMERSVYGDEAVPRSVLREWRKAHPLSILVLVDGIGRLLGYVTVVPVQRATLRRLVDGEIVEAEVRGTDVLPPSRCKEIHSLYLSSLTVECPRTLEGRRNACRLLRGLSAVVRQAYGGGIEEIFAIAATPDGERMCRRIGGAVHVAGTRRRDGHDLWRIPFAPSDRRRMEERLERNCAPTRVQLAPAVATPPCEDDSAQGDSGDERDSRA